MQFYLFGIANFQNGKDVLKNQEALINNLICEIDNTIEYGNIDEKILMDKCIGDQKKVNKKEKQLKMKLMQEELKYQKNQKALKRMNKFVVGGRKVPMIFNLKNFYYISQASHW